MSAVDKDRFTDDEMRDLLTEVLVSIRGGEVTEDIQQKVEKAIARRSEIEAEVEMEVNLSSIKDEFLDDLSALIAGLQVPLSMGILGAAAEPTRRMLALGSSFGWITKEDLRPALENHLNKIIVESLDAALEIP